MVYMNVWRTAAASVGFVAVIGAVMYPIYFYPMQHIDEYKAAQKVNRAGVDKSKTQPADLTIWSDPFKPKN